jgi:hypothetical protein
MCLMAKSANPMSQSAEMGLNQLAHNHKRERPTGSEPSKARHRRICLDGKSYILAFCVPFDFAICSICCRWLSIV